MRTFDFSILGHMTNKEFSNWYQRTVTKLSSYRSMPPIEQDECVISIQGHPHDRNCILYHDTLAFNIDIWRALIGKDFDKVLDVIDLLGSYEIYESFITHWCKPSESNYRLIKVMELMDNYSDAIAYDPDVVEEEEEEEEDFW